MACYHACMKASSQTVVVDEARHERMDALMAWWPYTDGSLRTTVEALFEDVLAERWSTAEEAQFLICAEAVWSRRRATRLFREQEVSLTWELLLLLTLPTTQLLLRRLEQREESQDIARLLRSPLADFALHEAERTEIELLLPQIEARLWSQYRAQIEPLIAEQEALRKTMKDEADREGTPVAKSTYEQAMVFATA